MATKYEYFPGTNLEERILFDILREIEILNAGGGGGGSVTSFSSGNLSPLFTTTVANASTTPTLSFTLNTQSANLVLAGPTTGSAAAPTFRSITRADIGNLYTQVGSIFSESWTNLTNWGNVGTPGASVTGNKLSFSGTASTTTNYIKNTSYGKFNYESGIVTWTETVGTVGVGTSGIGFALQSQSSLGASYQNSIMVNVELSTTTTGAIKWYYGGTLVQTSPVVLVPVATNVLNCKLIIYPEKYVFEYNINGGASVKDTLYFYTGVQFNTVGHNAAAFAFFNLGGGSSHSVGAIAISCTQNKNADFLFCGNSIISGYGNHYFYNRASTQIQKRAYNTAEIYARASNSVNDLSITEISALNPTKLCVLACSNDITVNGSASALTDLATFITAVGTISNTAAPTGYSIGNGNLVLCTELPRFAAGAAIATFNTSLISTYGIANIININGIASDGTISLPVQYTYDKVHPTDQLNSQIADEIIKFFGLIKRDIFTDSELFSMSYPGGQNTNFGNDVHLTSFAGYKFIAYNVYSASSGFFTRGSTGQTVLAGIDPNNGYTISVDTGIGPNGPFSPTRRLTIDFTGNISTNNTGTVAYRNTNAGASINAHMLIDPANSVTAGNAFSFDSTNGLGFTRANGTRRIQRAGIQLANNTDTAGSEQSDLSFLTQLAGAAVIERFRITASGGFVVNATNTATGTTGAQTINKPSGTVNIAAAGTSVVVTNSLVTTSSIIIPVIRTNDSTAQIKNIVPGAGSFTVTLVSAATAETSIGFFIIN